MSDTPALATVATAGRSRLLLGLTGRGWLVVAGVAGLALAVRLHDLTERELWLDEACTYYYVHNLFDWPADGPPMLLEVTSWPYVAALHAWTAVWGETPAGLRSFSVLAGCLAVLAVMGVAGRIAGWRSAVALGLLAAVHPLHVYYSQEARPYALWTLEFAVLYWLLFEAALRGRWRWWWAFGAVLLLTVATHYYTLFWLPASALAIIVATDRRRFVKQWLVTHVGLALVLVPFVLLVVLPVSGRGSQGWLQQVWASYPPILAIPRSLAALLPSGLYSETYLGPLSGAAAEAAQLVGVPVVATFARWGAALIAAALLGAWYVDRSQRRVPHSGSSADPCLVWLLLTSLAALLVPFAYSALRSPAYVAGRYDLAAWPAVTLVVALLVTQRRLARWTGAAALAGLLLASGLTLMGYKALPVQNPTADRARRLCEAVRPGDVVISLDMYRWFLVYELDRQGFAGRVQSFPACHDRQVGWSQPEAELADPGILAVDAQRCVTAVEQAVGQGHEAWLLGQGADPVGQQLIPILIRALHEAGYRVVPYDEQLGLGRIDQLRQ